MKDLGRRPLRWAGSVSVARAACVAVLVAVVALVAIDAEGQTPPEDASPTSALLAEADARRTALDITSEGRVAFDDVHRDGRAVKRRVYGTGAPLVAGAWRREGNRLVAEVGRVRYSLPIDLSAGWVEAARGEDVVRYRLSGARDAKAHVDGSQATFLSAAEGVDLRYVAAEDGLKEHLVLGDAEAAGRLVFEFRASPGLLLADDGEAGLVVRRVDGTVLMRLPPLVAVDADGAEAPGEALSYRLEDLGAGRWTVGVRVDDEWLGRADRRWPVDVDPTLDGQPAKACTIVSSSERSVCPSSADAELAAGSPLPLLIGGAGVPGLDARGLVSFDVAGVAPIGARMTSARLVLTAVPDGTWAPTGPVTLVAERVTRPWGAGASWTASNGAGGFLDEPSGDERPTLWVSAGGDVDATSVVSTEVGPSDPAVSLDITGEVRRWMRSPASNHGLLLHTAAGDHGLLWFASDTFHVEPEDAPRLQLTFSYGDEALEDDDDPTVEVEHSHAAPGELNAALDDTITVSAEDAGTGVAAVRLQVDDRVRLVHAACDAVEEPAPCPDALVREIDGADLLAGTLPDGSHEVSIQAIDAAGRRSSPVAWSVTVDRNAPEVTLEGRQVTRPGGSSFDVWTNQDGAALNVHAEDAGSGVTSLVLRDGQDTVDSADQSCAEGGCPLEHSFGVDTTDLDDDESIDRSVQAIDGAGNAHELQVRVMRDDVAPGLQVAQGAATEEAAELGRDAYPISIVADDERSGIDRVELKVDGQLVDAIRSACPGCQRPAELLLNTDELADGEHDVTVMAYDRAGNATDRSWTISVDEDATTPVIDAITGELTDETRWFGAGTSSAGVINGGERYQLIARGHVRVGGQREGVSYELLLDGDVVASAPVGPTGTLLLDTDELNISDGEHALAVRITAGGQAAVSPAWTFRYDHVGPAVTLEGTLAVAAAASTPLTDASYELSINASSAADDQSPLAAVETLVDGQTVDKQDLDQACSAGSCTASESWTLDPDEFDGGTHRVTVKVTDQAANTATRQLTVVVPRPPTLCRTGPTPEAAQPSSAERQRALTALEDVWPDVLDEPAGEDPRLETDDGQFASQNTRRDSVASTGDAGGVAVYSSSGPLCITPVSGGQANTAGELVADGAAAVYPASGIDSDTTIKPVDDGIETFVTLHSEDAPSSYAWRLDLHGDELLRQTQDGTVEVVDPSPPGQPTEAQLDADRRRIDEHLDDVRRQMLAVVGREDAAAGVGDQDLRPARRALDELMASAASRPPDRSQPFDDLAALVDHQRSINRETVDELIDQARQQSYDALPDPEQFERVVATVTAPEAKDADGQPVPVSLSVDPDEDTVTLDVDHDDPDTSYPVVADPIILTREQSIVHHHDPVGEWVPQSHVETDFGYIRSVALPNFAALPKEWLGDSYYEVQLDGEWVVVDFQPAPAPSDIYGDIEVVVPDPPIWVQTGWHDWDETITEQWTDVPMWNDTWFWNDWNAGAFETTYLLDRRFGASVPTFGNYAGQGVVPLEQLGCEMSSEMRTWPGGEQLALAGVNCAKPFYVLSGLILWSRPGSTALERLSMTQQTHGLVSTRPFLSSGITSAILGDHSLFPRGEPRQAHSCATVFLVGKPSQRAKGCVTNELRAADRRAPKLAISGALRDAAGRRVRQGDYPLAVDARDDSGIGRITIKVDGEVIEPTKALESCDPDCRRKRFTFRPQSYAEGPHTISVSAADAADPANATPPTTWTVRVARSQSTGIGPGSVDLLSGAITVRRSDVAVNAYPDTLGVDRAYSSIDPRGGTDGIFGPGWVASLPTDAPTSQFVALTVPSLTPTAGKAATLTTADGDDVAFLRDGEGHFRSPPGYEQLALTAESASGSYDTFTLTDTDTAATTRFEAVKHTETVTPVGRGGARFVPTRVDQPGQQNTVTVSWSYSATGAPRPVEVLAARPGGYDQGPARARTAAQIDTVPLARGNRSLTFTYGDQPGCRTFARPGASVTAWGDFKDRLCEVRLNAWDPGSGAVTQTVVARYAYDASGRLRQAWDPRITPALKERYDYNQQGLLTSLTPAGLQAWQIDYTTTQAPDGPPLGRVDRVRRYDPALDAWSTTTLRYGVPVSGGGAPYDLSAGQIASWGQGDPPVKATAVFPADHDPGAGVPTSYTAATVYYFDDTGRTVNVATPNGGISTTAYDEFDNVVRELTPANRQRALAAPDTQASANQLDTRRQYSIDGLDLLAEQGPTHPVTLADGTTVQARTKTTRTYSDHLPISETIAAARTGVADADARRTEWTYDTTLRKRLSETVDPGTGKLNLTKKWRYDLLGREISSTLPANPDGGDAHERLTGYYTADGSADITACRNRPEWAGLVCQTGPAAQPTTGPKLAVTTVTYARDQQIAGTGETYGTGVSRTKTISYDAAGRPTRQSVSSSGESPVSTTVAPITTTYNVDNGMAAQTTLGTGPSATTITRGYDTMGRLASYTDALDVQSTRTYDLVGRLASLNDTKGTTSFSYGSDGLLSGISDSRSGTQQATRDADGQVTMVALPGAIRRVDRFDATGARVARCYATGPAGCEDPLLELEAERGARGEIVAAHRAGFSDTRYAYDAAGRLTDATDDRDADGCTARRYTYDPDSNRLSRSWRHVAQGEACTVTGGQTESLTYDDGDRLQATGLDYDALGRTGELPAIGGGAALQARYFADDQARSVTQDGLTKTLTLDALRRTTTTLSSFGTSTSDHYTDDTDTPAWSTTDTTLERHVTGFDGTWALAEHDTTHSVLLADLRGDILATADPATHAITPTADLDEFGTPQTPTGRYGFLGTHARTSTLPSGLITMGARLYTPQLGRFLQVDPVISGSANAYDYCNAEPINCTDLRGTRPDGPSYYGELDSCVWGEGCDTSSELGAVLLTALAFAPVPGLQQYAAARVAITAARKYKSGGRLLGEIRWGAKGKNGRGSQYIRFDAGGRHGVHLDVRVGKFRKRHWKPWER